MVMAAPIVTQSLQAGLRQRHVAVIISFALTDMHQVSLAIDVTHLYMRAFPQSEPTDIQVNQIDSIPWAVDVAQHDAHFLDTQHDGQLLLTYRTHQLQYRPVSTQRVLIEKLDTS
jgi:hypothetical protein